MTIMDSSVDITEEKGASHDIFYMSKVNFPIMSFHQNALLVFTGSVQIMSQHVWNWKGKFVVKEIWSCVFVV